MKNATITNEQILERIQAAGSFTFSSGPSAAIAARAFREWAAQSGLRVTLTPTAGGRVATIDYGEAA